jgi:hypothetical protein
VLDPGVVLEAVDRQFYTRVKMVAMRHTMA